MFKKNLNDNWLASSNDKTEKKNNKRNFLWFWIKKLIILGLFTCKILAFFSSESS